jgi:PPM family protein phosphatase
VEHAVEAVRLVDAAGVTDRGLVRKENQDAFCIDADAGVLLVADGMGGCGGGATAAAIVAKDVPEALAKLECSLEDAVQQIPDVLQTVSERVHRMGQEQPNLISMGAAVVFAIVGEGKVLVANLGDSRAYRLREGRSERLTRDHTLGAALVEANEIEEAALAAHPLRNALARYIGMPSRVEPDVSIIDVADGDWLLLCSDGLACVNEDEFCGLIASSADARGACDALVAAANAGGGTDNATVVLAKFGCEP